MVIYTKEEKRIIIPEGLGGYVTGDCRAIAEEAREQGYESGYTQGYNDGVLADCGEAIEEAFNDGFESGYTQGQADCPECSGGTCNLENGRVELGRNWGGNNTFYPGEGYDGFSSIQITDNGYGNEKYQSGYTQGYNDGQGGGCNLQDKSVYQNSNLVTYYPDEGYDGMRSIYVDATGVYSNGHTAGQNYARSLMVSSAFTDNGTYTNPNGWNSVTVDVPAPPIMWVEKRFNLESGDTSPWTVLPDYTRYMTEVIVTDNGYGQGKYTEGYEAGLQACSGSSCNLTDTWIDLMNGDDFEGQGVDYYVSAITPNYDGWYKVHIQDKDYGQSKYAEGYTAGFTAGEGEIHTLEIVIKTENNYYEAFTGDTRITMVLDEGEGVEANTTPYDQSNIIEGDGRSEYMGTYNFNTQDSDDPSLYYISQIYDTTAKTLTLCFKGYLYNNSGVYPQPIYGCPSAVGVEIMASNINNWGNWSVETVRFNGRPLYDNHGWLSKIGNGGFKLKPTYYEDNPAVLNNHRQIFITTFA